MRAGTKAAKRPQAEPFPPPPMYEEHAVTIRLHRHVYDMAQWAYRYEEATDRLLHPSGRTFEEFLADCIEGGLELPAARWQRETGQKIEE